MIKKIAVIGMSVILAVTGCTAAQENNSSAAVSEAQEDEIIVRAGNTADPADSAVGFTGNMNDDPNAFTLPAGDIVYVESGDEDTSVPEVRADNSDATEEAAFTNGGTAERPGLVILEEDGVLTRAKPDKVSRQADPEASVLFSVRKKNGGTETAAALNGMTQKEYTVMVYTVGSNLESLGGHATKDMAEMRSAGIDYSRTNLLVYTGGSLRWVSDIPNDCNCVLDMAAADGTPIVARTETTANMGLSETLAEFINYCTSNYPADHYALILWDHGGGPVKGYGNDELFRGDSLLLAELRAAMEKTVFAAGNGPGLKLDWVGYDACLMGTIESVDLWKEYAGYLVGSEENVPGNGWDYSCLSALNNTSDVREIINAVVDSYERYYANTRSDFYNPDVTLSAMDLSRADSVISAAGDFFGAVNAELAQGRYASLNQARMRSKAFGLCSAESREDAYDLIDLRDFAGNFSGICPDESRALIHTIDQMVIRSTANVDGAGGVSAYIPGDNFDLYEESRELYSEEGSFSEQYDQFVDSYTKAWLSGASTDWELGALRETGDELTLELTEAQAASTSEAFYSILQRGSSGTYSMTTCNVRITPDENNILHIPADPMLLTAGTDLKESSQPWVCTQVESAGGESVYRTVRTLLSPGHEFTGVDLSVDEEVSISFRNRDGEKEVTVLDVSSSTGSAVLGGKGSVDVTGFQSIKDIGGDTFSPLRDRDGRMKPYNEWKKTGYIYYSLPIDNSFHFSMKHASEIGGKKICQVTIKDVNGKVHATEYKELPAAAGNSNNMVVMSTDKGYLIIELSEDHAQIYGYMGSDTEISVPDHVSDKPVTAIGEYAFCLAEDLESIKLPDTVTRIECGAFHSTKALRRIRLPNGLLSIGTDSFMKSGIEEIEIPDSVEEIGRAAFANTDLSAVRLPDSLRSIGAIPFLRCGRLTEIVISDSNDNYKTVDGVLYTGDGRTLIQYPNGRDSGEESEYVIRDGTETIRYGAFAGASLRNVTFPESLLMIENDAFFDCRDLESLELPDSLEVIGDFAFGFRKDDKKAAEKTKTPIGTVRIGPNVRSIGDDAFIALGIRAFEVDEDNATFSSKGGFITNKAGDSIISVPLGVGEIVVVPDGITTLQNGVFADLDKKTEFFIPDCTYRFSETVFPSGSATSKETGRSAAAYFCKLHCSKGSAAEKYAARYGIVYDNRTEEEEQTFEVVEETVGKEAFVWRVYGNHAELCGYKTEIKDMITEFAVPSQYRGLPVTALSYDEKRKDEIYGGLLKRIVLSENIESVDTDFFRSFVSIDQIDVDAGNPYLTCEDGVLFSKDKKTLLYYPAWHTGEEYAIPAGVKTVGEKAFYLCLKLRKVTMPRSLRVIGKNSFAMCSNIKEVSFNEGLREINDYAFYFDKIHDVKLPSSVEWIGSSAFRLHDEFGEVRLPDKLKKTGRHAFWAAKSNVFSQEVLRIPPKFEIGYSFIKGLGFERYEVAPKSAFYTAVDGLLMSKDCETLVSVPTLREGDLIVPENTLYIDYYAFDGCDSITDIYLPDSLLSIGHIDVKLKSGAYKYTIHCSEGSEAQKILDARNVPWTAGGK